MKHSEEAFEAPRTSSVAPAGSGGAPGLYVHVPFCASVCPYCDFAVQTGGPKKHGAYVASLVREIHARGEDPPTSPPGAEDATIDRHYADAANVAATGDLRWRSPQPFDTVYVGGGTPSSLTEESLGRILAAVREALPVASYASVTLEANPEDVDTARLRAWKNLGVSRLSLGVQSFDADALTLLGRAHTVREASAAVELSMGAGFDAVSLDLIFAVPGQTTTSWRDSLRRTVELRPQHVSCYELTVHEGTRFYRARQRGRLVETLDEDKAEQFFVAHRVLEDGGYSAYEVSNFARAPRWRSRHNAKYWDHTPFLGLGPSAHSFDGKGTRCWNERRLIDWQTAVDETGSAICGKETLSPEQLVLEALALGLRTTRGVDLDVIGDRYGIDLRRTNEEVIDGFIARGLLEPRAGAALVPTLRGLALADTLAAAFEILDPSR